VFTSHCGLLVDPPTGYAVVRAARDFADAAPQRYPLATAA